MKISSTDKKILIDEIDFVIQKIKEEDNPEIQIYYYSAIFTMAQRILNINYDPHLEYIHLVLSGAFSIVQDRLARMKTGDQVVEFIPGFFDYLVGYLEELRDHIKANKETHKTLEKIMVLSNLTTGNGYYRYKKGITKPL